MAKVNYVPTEHDEQVTLFRWACMSAGMYPELRLMFHIPNEGHRSYVTGRRMRAEGLRKGVPDICLPVARRGHNALFIEMKRTRHSRTSDEQREWIDELNRAGNLAVICKGFEEARNTIIDYLTGE